MDRIAEVRDTVACTLTIDCAESPNVVAVGSASSRYPRGARKCRHRCRGGGAGNYG